MTDYHKRPSATVTSNPTHRWSFLIVGVFACLLVCQVIVSNRLATKGYEISQVEQQIQELKSENNLYEEQIASSSSLLAVRQKSEKLGFTKTAKPVFLSTDAQVAVLN